VWSDENLNKLLSCLDDTEWTELLSSTDVNTATDVFVEYLNFSIENCIPSRTIRLPANNKSWMTPRITRMIGYKHTAYLTGSPEHHKLKAQVQKAIREAKHIHASDIESKMQSNSRVAWSQLKSILKLKNNVPGCSLNADTMNSFFNRFDKSYDMHVLPQLYMPFDEFSFEEVYATLRGVKVNKSPGPDTITGRLLKSAAPVLAEPLTTIFNRSIQQGTMPQIWKTATIKPIQKCAGAVEPKDFRPIALTSVVGKCLDQLVMKRLAPNLSYPTQFAY
jgi:hypothetical protein